MFFWKLSEVVSKQKEKPHPLGDGERFVPLVLETGIVLQSTTCPQWLHCRLKGVSLPVAQGPLPGWSELGSLMWNHELQETKLISLQDKVRLMQEFAEKLCFFFRNFLILFLLFFFYCSGTPFLPLNLLLLHRLRNHSSLFKTHAHPPH